MDLQKQLRELEEQHIGLEARQNREKLAHILAEDFFEIGSSGHLVDKKQCLDFGVNLNDMTIHHYDISPLSSEVVLATYFLIDHTRHRNTLRSSIWKLIDGRWQLYFHQGTITPLSLHEVTNVSNSS
ncbi:DUF4440 domain-containing protein [Bacillaceae bacterium SIJ1]|uniref:nuclear transport factor 2 family protein n=1 Tax=Litoribacterium kuwaitense TaxID=1398745 RepID=UPI0013E9FCC1|nr:DUF4440 domain-containing protein [Litoribacterium kuwaitense]NGP44965.1 DUF4440 domain-containing protein [Litoribacterium kuwaitense]